MAVETVAEQIRNMIANNWSLLGNLVAVKVHFDVGWYDAKYSTRPQVTVRHLMTPMHRFFGPDVEGGHVGYNIMAFERHIVNCWLEIRRGMDGNVAENQIDEMRREVVRIMNNQCKSYPPPLGLVIPLDQGLALHEWDRTPRLLRYEILVQATYHI